MAKVARCPSCGAPVAFQSIVSVLAVCDYCQSTLLRRGEEFENLGKMAALIEDRSPLQRGSEGRWRGIHFALIGRIQLRYEQGMWNEWHLLFDDGKSGWLSEAGGEFVLSLPLAVSGALPSFSDVQVGQWLTVDGRNFTVTLKLTAECVAGEGELPFKVGAGYAAPVVDLRDEQGGFATLDYSDDAARPLVFVGESVDFSRLDWANLREPTPLPVPAFQVRAFNCPNCGAPRKVTHADTVTVGCQGCGAVLDTSHAEVTLIERVEAEIKRPRLPLGSKGTLRGESVELIGYLRRSMRAEGIEYPWDEYLCQGKNNDLIWLTEYQGHWNIARTLPRSIDTTHGDLKVDGQTYKHFQTYQAHVRYVLGEFPWRVRVDEVVKVADYVAPPRMLSWESSADEVTWTLAEYAEPQEIALAFDFEQSLPEPQGVFANQPNPHAERHRLVCRRFWIFFLAGLAIYGALLFFSPGARVLQQSLVFTPDDDEPQLTREFRLTQPTARLEVEHDTDVSNSWLALDMTLVNRDSGETWQVQREISRYTGVEDGEGWAEGSGADRIVFVDLPAGNYVLAEDAEIGADTSADPFAGLMVPDLASGNMVPMTKSAAPAKRPVHAQLSITRLGPRFSSFVLLALFLACFPLVTRIASGSFEVRRWADSDHPIVTAESDD